MIQKLKQTIQTTSNKLCDCKKKPNIITTPIEGELICKDCGVVMGYDEFHDIKNRIDVEHLSKTSLDIFQQRQLGTHPNDSRMAMLFLDMRITLSLKDLIKQHEENGIFRFLYTKCKKRSVAVTLQLIIEAVFVLVLPSLMFPREFGVTLFWDSDFSNICRNCRGLSWNSLVEQQKKYQRNFRESKI